MEKNARPTLTIEIFGEEYLYTTSGIQHKETEFDRNRKSKISLGQTRKSAENWRDWIDEKISSGQFIPSSYDELKNNNDLFINTMSSFLREVEPLSKDNFAKIRRML